MSEICGSQSEIAEVPFNAHQKQTALGVLMLVGVQDVRVVAVQKIGDRRDDPFAVRTIDQEDGGVFHRQRSLIRFASVDNTASTSGSPVVPVPSPQSPVPSPPSPVLQRCWWQRNRVGRRVAWRHAELWRGGPPPSSPPYPPSS